MANKKPPSDPPNSETPDSEPPSSLLTELPTLSDEELMLLTVEAPREFERRKAKREAEFMAFIREQAAVLGISMDRLIKLLGGKSKGRKQADDACCDGRRTVKPKYRNPRNPEQTWSGRGAAKPAWVVEHLAAGGTLEECAIPEGEA